MSTSLVLLWAWLTGGTVLYGNTTRQMKARWCGRFIKERFAEISSRFTIEPNTHLKIYELVENRTQEIESLSLFKALCRFFPHSKLGVAVRRALIFDGFMQVMLSMEVEQVVAQGRQVKFAPRTLRPFLLRQFPSASKAIPLPWLALLYMKAFFDRLFLPLYYVGGCSWLLLRNGLCKRLPDPQKWAICQRIDGFMMASRIRDNELIYNGGALAPEKVLHWLEDEPTPGFWEYVQKKQLSVVQPRNLSITWGFVWRRLVLGYFPLLVGNAIVDGTIHKASIDVVKAILHIGWHILEAERFALHYRPHVYFGWDAYMLQANVRAMVWEQYGGHSVLYIHGAPWVPLYMYQNVYAHVLLCSGARVRDMFGKTLQHVQRVVPVGLMNTELALEADSGIMAFRSASSGSHIVVAFDSTYSPFWGLTEDVFRVFYRGLLDLVEKWPQVTLLLKRKNQEDDVGYDRNPAYEAVAVEFGHHPRIRVVYDESTYSLLSTSDSAIAITSSTTGSEALVCRKPVLFFDPREQYRNHPFWEFAPSLVCHTVEELLERFGQILEGQYLDEKTWDRIVEYEARYAEERPLTAVRNLLLQEAGVR